MSGPVQAVLSEAWGNILNLIWSCVFTLPYTTRLTHNTVVVHQSGRRVHSDRVCLGDMGHNGQWLSLAVIVSQQSTSHVWGHREHEHDSTCQKQWHVAQQRGCNWQMWSNLAVTISIICQWLTATLENLYSLQWPKLPCGQQDLRTFNGLDVRM